MPTSLCLEQIKELVAGEPGFEVRTILDKNPLSGHTKRRQVSAPNVPMSLAHAVIRYHLESYRPLLESAAACLPGSSATKNVRRHIGPYVRQTGRRQFHRHFYLLDLRDAYQAVDPATLAAILARTSPQAFGNIEAARELVGRFCVSPGIPGLAVGAPSSPDLFNIYCEETLDKRLRETCSTYSITYSRYLDDLAFSSDQKIGGTKRRAIRSIILAGSFAINHRKAAVIDLKKGPVTINGIGVRYDGSTFYPRGAARRLLGIMHGYLAGRHKDIDRIHGLMGSFLSTTDRRRPNALEKKILAAYAECRLKQP